MADNEQDVPLKADRLRNMRIRVAEEIADRFGYDQIIVHSYDRENGQILTTWGRSLDDKVNAAKGGDVIKKLLNFPEEALNAKPPMQLDYERLKKENLEMREKLYDITKDDKYL